MEKRKLIVTLLLSIAFVASAFSQAKKPKIMVVPDHDWCIRNGYYKEFENQGEKTQVPDFDKAFIQEEKLNNAITAIQEIMAGRGFPLQDMRSRTTNSNNRNARRAARQKTAVENPIDALLRTVKADILVELSWTVYQHGPNKNIAFNLKGVDAYTDKAVAPVNGAEVTSSAAGVNDMIKASVLNQMPKFCDLLQNHFDDLLANGREITFSVEVEEGALPEDLNTRFNDTPLSRIIRKWVSENTVNGNFSVESSSESYIDFEQVRIPCYDADNIALDAATWSDDLVNMLRTVYKLKTSVDEIGLGRIEILITK